MGDDLLRRLDAGHSRHVEVHDDHVGLQLTYVAKRVVAGRCLAYDVDALLLEQVSQPRAEQVVVVDQQHARAYLVGGGRRLDGFSHLNPLPSRGSPQAKSTGSAAGASAT